MINAEKLLGGLISGVLGGGRSKAATGAIAKGALGLAIATVEHFREKHRQGQQEPATAKGSAPPPPPATGAAPPPPPPGVPSGPPLAPSTSKSSQGQYDAILLIRAMIASAYADGRLDPAERSKILKRLETVDLDAEERAFMQAELDQPKDPADLVVGVKNPQMAQQVYAVSLMAVTVDTETEKKYLNQLAASLGLSQADRAKVHDLVKVPLF